MTKQEFEKGIKRVLIPQTEIQEKIQAVGAQITKEYEGKPLLLVSILNGAFVEETVDESAEICYNITSKIRITALGLRKFELLPVK